jgi:hypothetical protein
VACSKHAQETRGQDSANTLRHQQALWCKRQLKQCKWGHVREQWQRNTLQYKSCTPP